VFGATDERVVEFVGCWRYFWERYWIKGARDQRDKLGFDQLNEQGLGRRLNNVDMKLVVRGSVLSTKWFRLGFNIYWGATLPMTR